MARAYPVYIVDDQEMIRTILAGLCDLQGWPCRSFATGAAFMEAADTLAPGCVLLDMRLPGYSGLRIQAELASRTAPFVIVGITGHGDVEMAVESMKLGAIDFLQKPFDNETLIDAVQRAFETIAGEQAGA